MRRFLLLSISVTLIVTLPPSYTLSGIFQYVDDNGVSNYTNVFSRIEEKYRDNLIITEEIKINGMDGGGQFLSGLNPAENKTRNVERIKPDNIVDANKKALRKVLEDKYAILLSEKASLDTNKSYQKRKFKRKYKHRPHIVEMSKRETQLDAMLNEVENQLLNCNC